MFVCLRIFPTLTSHRISRRRFPLLRRVRYHQRYSPEQRGGPQGGHREGEDHRRHHPQELQGPGS